MTVTTAARVRIGALRLLALADDTLLIPGLQVGIGRMLAILTIAVELRARRFSNSIWLVQIDGMIVDIGPFNT